LARDAIEFADGARDTLAYAFTFAIAFRNELIGALRGIKSRIIAMQGDQAPSGPPNVDLFPGHDFIP
jgi:hypothetical protein